MYSRIFLALTTGYRSNRRGGSYAPKSVAPALKPVNLPSLKSEGTLQSEQWPHAPPQPVPTKVVSVPEPTQPPPETPPRPPWGIAPKVGPTDSMVDRQFPSLGSKREQSEPSRNAAGLIYQALLEKIVTCLSTAGISREEGPLRSTAPEAPPTVPPPPPPPLPPPSSPLPSLSAPHTDAEMSVLFSTSTDGFEPALSALTGRRPSLRPRFPRQ